MPSQTGRFERILHPLLTVLLLALSGNPFVTLAGRSVILASFVGVLLILVVWKHRLPDMRLIGVCAVFLVIFMAQVFTLNSLPLLAMAGFFCLVFAGWATVHLVRDFSVMYVRVMVGLAVMSLVFWVIGISGLAESLISRLRLEPFLTRQWTGDQIYTIVVHTYLFPGRGGLLRNAGMFGEPGLFVGYLAWALVLLRIDKPKFTARQYRWFLLTLSVTLASTLSTAGYILLPLVLVLHVAHRPQSKKAYPLIAAVLVLVACLALIAPKISRLSFLWPKISSQFEATTNQSSGWETTRFGSIVFDLGYIRQRPIFGWGPLPQTRFASNQVTGMGNGLSGFTAEYGLVGIFTYLLILLTSLRQVTGKSRTLAAYCLVLALIMLNGEPFLNYPLFWAIGFLGWGNAELARQRVRQLRAPTSRGPETSPSLTTSEPSAVGST